MSENTMKTKVFGSFSAFRGVHFGVHFGGQNGIHSFARAPPKLNRPFWTLVNEMNSGIKFLAFPAGARIN